MQMEEFVFVKAKDVGNAILEMIGSEKFNQMLQNCDIQTKEFRNGAVFGAAMASTWVSAYCEKFVFVQKECEGEIE